MCNFCTCVCSWLDPISGLPRYAVYGVIGYVLGTMYYMQLKKINVDKQIMIEDYMRLHPEDFEARRKCDPAVWSVSVCHQYIHVGGGCYSHMGALWRHATWRPPMSEMFPKMQFPGDVNFVLKPAPALSRFSLNWPMHCHNFPKIACWNRFSQGQPSNLLENFPQLWGKF